MDKTSPHNPQTIFNNWQQVLEAAASTGQIQFEGKIQWLLQGDTGGSWLMLGGDAPKIERTEGKADCTLSLSVEDFLEIASGELNPQVAYMNGQIEVQGDLSTVLQLSVVLDQLISKSS